MLRLFEQLHIKNGVFLVSAFVENNTIHLYDPGFRLQGESPDIPIKKICHYDQKEMLVRFALTVSMLVDFPSKGIIDYSFNAQKVASIWLLGKEGRLRSIEGLQNASKHPSCISVVQRLFAGDEIRKPDDDRAAGRRCIDQRAHVHRASLGARPRAHRTTLLNNNTPPPGCSPP